MRYRVVESKGKHHKIEYQENGGGTLTTSATIEFDIEQRNIRRDGKPTTIRVIRVASYSQNVSPRRRAQAFRSFRFDTEDRDRDLP